MAMTSQEKRDGSLDAERAVIGAMLIVESVGDLLTIHRLSRLAKGVNVTYTVR